MNYVTGLIVSLSHWNISSTWARLLSVYHCCILSSYNRLLTNICEYINDWINQCQPQDATPSPLKTIRMPGTHSVFHSRASLPVQLHLQCCFYLFFNTHLLCFLHQAMTN
jgi:hypothetical protein